MTLENIEQDCDTLKITRVVNITDDGQEKIIQEQRIGYVQNIGQTDKDRDQKCKEQWMAINCLEVEELEQRLNYFTLSKKVKALTRTGKTKVSQTKWITTTNLC